MELLDLPLESDRMLAGGNGDVYRRILHDDAVVIVPGAVLDKAACAAEMDRSAGWDSTDLAQARIVEGPDTATIVYTFTGLRGSETYSAIMSSTYVRTDADWRLLVHQHTPM